MTRPCTMPLPWSQLADQLGGVTAFAEKVGVGRITVWRWARKDLSPVKAHREILERLFEDHGLEPPEFR